MSDTDSRSTPSSPNTLRQRNPLRSESSKKALKKLPGSRSKWSTLHSWSDKLQWFLLTPIRFVLCISNVTLFLFAYLGFMLPMLWAQTLWPRLYWGYEGKLYRWLQAFIGYWGYTAGYDIYEYGDDIAQYCDSDRVLVMVNHQSTADVPCLFAILQHKGVASRKTIWLMDQMFRWTPFGIIGQMHGDYFIKQGKATRDTELDRLKEHLRNVFWERDRRWVVLFPEGGFYYKRIEQSQAYGKKNGFPHLEHVTLPRMGAVKAILEEVGPREDDDGEMVKTKSGSKIEILKDTIGAIREKKYVKETRPPIKYVLDITIAYPNGQPLSLWTLCFGTREKCDIAVHYKIFKADEVPFDDEIKLRDWMYSVYEHKDQLLDNFYQFGKFDRHDTGDRIIFPCLIDFLKEHEYLYKYPNKDFFTKNIHEIFFQKWPNLCKIKKNELLKLPYDKEIHDKCDPKLANFFEKTRQLSILKPFPTVSNNVEIPKHLFLKMKKKKEYEIKQLLPVFLKECEKVGVQTVIDIGCGTGNLIKILQYFGMKCIGIEANSEFCKAAKEANPNAMIFNEFVTVNSISKIKDVINVHGPAALISLHGCGNLQKVLLQIKVSIDSNQLPLLFTLGCCYHKRTNSNEINNVWAISETIKTKLKDVSINLPTSALRLGCDRGLLQWTKQTPEQFEAHKNAVFNRAVIETIFPEETSIQRNTNRNLKGNLISTICDKHNIPANEREIKEEELRKAFEKYSNFKNGIQPFSMLQSGIQSTMETLILLDSAYFLKENNQPASFQSLFDVLQSPRNICLISSSA